jgi:HEAT repeat protein
LGVDRGLAARPGASLSAGQALDKNAQRVVNDATKDLKSKDVQKRVDAIDNLRSWGKVTTAPLIIGALRDPEARVRAAAADALWNGDMKTEAARAPLMAALDDPAPEVAVLAAGALRVLGASKADVQGQRALVARPADSLPAVRGRWRRAASKLVDPLISSRAAGGRRCPQQRGAAEHALEELRDTRIGRSSADDEPHRR